MGGRKQVCALPGCNIIFESVAADQKYCSPDHRKLARSRRVVHAATRRNTPAAERPPELVGVGASGAGAVRAGYRAGGSTRPLPPRTAGPYRRLVPEPRLGPWQQFMRFRRLRATTGPRYAYTRRPESPRAPTPVTARLVRPVRRRPRPPARPPNRPRRTSLRPVARGGTAFGIGLLGIGKLLARGLFALVLLPVGLVSGAVGKAAALTRSLTAHTPARARTRTPARTRAPALTPAPAPTQTPPPTQTPAPTWAPAPPRTPPPTQTPPPTRAPAPPQAPPPARTASPALAGKDLAWREAAAVLAGTPLPGEQPPPRRGRRGVRRPRGFIDVFATETPGTDWRSHSTMPVSETLRSALEAVAKNGLRSALTMIGIIIGVASVIALVALGNGMRTNFDAQFSRLGNLITITSTSMGGPKYGNAKDLTERDVKAISDPHRTPDIVSVSPSVSDNVTLTLGQVQSRTKMIGVQSNYLDLMDRKIIAGQWFSPSQMTGNERVAVLGEDPVTLLWGRGARPEDVIGSRVRVKSMEFKVIGVLKSDGQNDNVVATPFGSARAYLVGGNETSKIDQIVVRASSVAALDRASGEIATVMDDTHNIRDPGKRDYNVLTYTNLLNKTASFIKNLTLFIVAIAGISLLVGGIGVANIMLVSVTERTREIGIRKAIGAKSRYILRQFLSEAVMLTGIGGVVGVGLGIGATLIAARLLPPAGSTEATETNFPAPILTAQPVVVGFVVSLIIGVLAGMYPAYRATRMRPVDALRFE